MSVAPAVLLVEDDHALQQVLADALEREGFAVTVESDGGWAVRTATQRRFDVIILDLLLPTLDGYAVARRLRAEAPGETAPAVIFISGVYRPTETGEELKRRYGGVAFFAKPFEVRELLKVLKETLAQRPASEASAPAVESPETSPPDPSAQAEAELVESATRRLSGLRAFAGDLARQPFPEVLSDVHRWRASGALLLQREQVKKIVYLRDGVPTSVKSNLMSECLGRVLVRERLISEQECEESVHRMRATQKRQGAVLVGMGSISPQNLAYGLSLQLRTKLYDVFAWTAGEFQFVPHVETPPEPVQLGRLTASLLYEGIRRAFFEERLRARLGSIESLYPRRSAHPLTALQDLGLPDEEADFLRTIDGRHTVAELRRAGALARLEVDRLLYALGCAQVIDLLPHPSELPSPVLPPMVRAPPPPPPAAAPPPPDAPDEVTVPTSMGGSATPTEDAIPLEALPEHRSPEEALRPGLLARAELARTQDHFALLAVARTAPKEALEQSFLSLASEYHPDRFTHLTSMELKALAAEIYERAMLAYETLSDPTERARYESALDTGGPPPSPASVERLFRAENRFRQGQDRLNDGDIPAAHALFNEAVETYPLEGNFYAYLGWSRYLLDARRSEEALSLLERAAELNPTLDRVYLFLGNIYRALGQVDRAEEQYEKALACNPTCAEALAELKVLGIRPS